MGKLPVDRDRVDGDLPPPPPYSRSTMDPDMEMQIVHRINSAGRREPATNEDVRGEREVTAPIANTTIGTILAGIKFLLRILVATFKELLWILVAAIEDLLVILAMFPGAILASIFGFRFLRVLLGTVALVAFMAVFFAAVIWLIAGWIGAKDVLLTALGFGNTTSY